MKRFNIRILTVCIVLVSGLVACRSNQIAATSTPSSNISSPKSTTISSDELFRAADEGAGVTQGTFSIIEAKRIRVNWEQSSADLFILVLINMDPEMAGTPYHRVTFEYFVGPSSGYGDYALVPGEYGFEIKKGDGPWEIWVQEIVFEGE